MSKPNERQWTPYGHNSLDEAPRRILFKANGRREVLQPTDPIIIRAGESMLIQDSYELVWER